MYWLDEVKAHIKRRNKILFSKDCELLRPLTEELSSATRLTAVLWALDFAQQIADELTQRYPADTRPRDAVDGARAWTAGSIKMPLAQRLILDCHAMAKELDNAADIALCHAVGQACAVVHTAGHALGLPMYELSAIVYRLGVDNCAQAVEARAAEYCDRLAFWKVHEQDYAESIPA
ncbi:MAG: hypothetical protein J6J62_01090, partial [Oscillospiraceae bacterium]|nr:hypothetical protein [Oscillospiraceae bacterium]